MSIDDMRVDQTIDTDVLVIGGGGAAVRAAVAAFDAGATTTVVLKGQRGRSGATMSPDSPGVAWQHADDCWSDEDSPEVHFRNIVDVGLGMADPRLARILAYEVVEQSELLEHWLPTFVSSWLENQELALPCEVRETASVTDGYDLTTYLTPAYALGTASRTYSTGAGILAIEQMANHLMLHYTRPGQPGGWGVMYSRYVVNDQHWGTLSSFAFRPETNFLDQGHFAGVQLRNKAIALYALIPLYNTYVASLKTVVVFQSGDALE